MRLGSRPDAINADATKSAQLAVLGALGSKAARNGSPVGVRFCQCSASSSTIVLPCQRRASATTGLVEPPPPEMSRGETVAGAKVSTKRVLARRGAGFWTARGEDIAAAGEWRTAV